MDLSPEGLLQAKRHCATVKVSLLQGSGFALPFRDGSLPVVYASQVLHIFDAQGRLAVMREVRRVLQPGGRFVFDMKNLATHPWRYLRTPAARRARNFPQPRTLRHLLTEAGFSRIDIQAGLFPLIGALIGPAAGPLCALAHTRFYVARP
jgi:SAM-dependent methyltransferase